MSYSVKELSEISGVSVRTLHRYDKTGLLVPTRNEQNGYRIYLKEDVDRLQDILYFRELGMELSEIDAVLKANANSRADMLISYKANLITKRKQIDNLLKNVDKTINSLKGKYLMKTNEKFEAFKEKLIEDNETAYGFETRKRYGDKAVDDSNELIRQMGQERYNEMQALGDEINELLKHAVDNSYSPKSEKGNEIAKKHREWLSYTWKNYSPEAHKGLANTYIADERFSEYYDKSAKKGAAQFLHDAILANV